MSNSTLDKEPLYASLIGVLAREKNTDTVLAVSRKIADKYATDPYALYLHAMLTAQNGNPEEALSYFDRSLAIKTIDGAHSSRAKILLKMGQPEEAILSLEKALADQPNKKKRRTLGQVGSAWHAPPNAS